MNRYKFFGVIAVIGILFTVFGAWGKILHKAFADIFITIGMFGEGIGFSALVWFAFDYLNKKNKQSK